MPYWPCRCQPCQCTSRIDCIKLSAEEIRNVFESSTAVLVQNLFLELAEDETKYPKDIISKHIALTIELFDTHHDPKNISLEIHPEAFRYSRNVTKHFILKNLEMFNFDWSFLAEFNQLKNITILDSFNVQLTNLPLLPSLIELHIFRSTGFKNMINFPILLNGLKRLVIQDSGLNDKEMDRILNCIQNGPSNETLRYIYINGNALTQIPRQLYSFPHLIDIFIDRQKSPGLGIISELSFLAPINVLNFHSSHISEIKPAAFKGFYIFIRD